MSMWRRLAAVGAVTALGLSLAACSSNPTNGSASSTSTSAKSGTGGSRGSNATDVPNNVPNQVSVRKDVAVQNCAATAGGWSAGGTVQNTLGHDTTYHIDVFFTSAQATDLAYGVTTVAVPAGQTKLWSVSATFAAPAQVLCVLRGVSTS